MMVVIGIDPGVTGAIGCLIDGKFNAVVEMPTMQRTVKQRQVDPKELANILTTMATGGEPSPFTRVMVMLEHAMTMPGQSSQSGVLIGINNGICEGVIAALGLPYEMVWPATWKRAMELQSDRSIEDPGKRKKVAKAFALAKAQRLWPMAPLSRVKDHNAAEALLIARYGDQKHRRSGDPLAIVEESAA